MADILIRGMEMPKEPTPLTLYPDGRWNDYTDGANGEFLPIPAGHGRLGDLDALVSKYTEEINNLEEWAKNHEKEGRLEMFRACHLRSAYLAEAKLNIEAAPTIVPAEGGGKDG